MGHCEVAKEGIAEGKVTDGSIKTTGLARNIKRHHRARTKPADDDYPFAKTMRLDW